MTFKPAIWRPIALLLAAANLVGVGFAAGATEPLHAAAHAALALGFGWWAQRLRQRAGSEHEAEIEGQDVDRLEAFEFELSKLRQELSETQERLDFTERLLAQRPDPRRVSPDR
jgi:hypothetical protein